ncbi:MAG: phosphoribosylamine--glycine ligase [Acidobacteriota bacterium]
MKVLVIGSGGREHALIWKISQSKRVDKIFAIPGNCGIGELAENIEIDATNIIEIADFAQKEEIHLTIVGPELPLSLGIVDEFNKRNLKIFGPTQKAAQIESSKVFAKEFMKKNKIPTSKFKVFNSAVDAVNYLKEVEFPVVIKTDGLAAGKGVFVCKDKKEAEESVRTILLESKFGKAGEQIIIEDFLEGQELSFIVISDGKRALPMATSMDYKKAYENDEGPNTGGMGAISPSPIITEKLFNEIMKTIITPTIEGMRFEGKEFRGVLYAGLMITSKGPITLEFNARFGDPETQALMLRLQSDIVDIFEGSVEGSLFDVETKWDENVSACVVLASEGYPGNYETGVEIDGLKRAKASGSEVFHAGTKSEGNKYYTAGGRVLNVCAKDKTLRDTMEQIYDSIQFIKFDNIFYRKDIGGVKK